MMRRRICGAFERRDRSRFRSPTKSAAADLTGDGSAEVLVAIDRTG